MSAAGSPRTQGGGIADMEAVRIFFSFRSPYSYLVAPRAFSLSEQFRVKLEWRGIRPMVARGVPLSRAKMLYILRDAARVARRIGMPFGKIADTLGEGANRCLAVAEVASEQGLLAPFILRVGRATWSEGADVSRDSVLRPVVEEVGLDWATCRAAIEGGRYKSRIDSNAELLSEIGHWGVPTFEIRGEVFWGQDRFAALCRHIEALGLGK